MEVKQIRRPVLGVTFIAAGVNHFLRPRLYQAIMPDYLPWHAQLVALSGYAGLVSSGLRHPLVYCWVGLIVA